MAIIRTGPSDAALMMHRYVAQHEAERFMGETLRNLHPPPPTRAFTYYHRDAFRLGIAPHVGETDEEWIVRVERIIADGD